MLIRTIARRMAGITGERHLVAHDRVTQAKTELHARAGTMTILVTGEEGSAPPCA